MARQLAATGLSRVENLRRRKKIESGADDWRLRGGCRQNNSLGMQYRASQANVATPADTTLASSQPEISSNAETAIRQHLEKVMAELIDTHQCNVRP